MIKDKIKKSVSKKREKQTRYLSQAIQLEEGVNPHIIRSTMSMVSLTIIVFITWAGFTNINEVARTPGEVVPYGHQQTVQHLEGGIVKKIAIKEGEVVEEGQVLLYIDDASIREDLQRAQIKDLTLEMQEERLRAFVENREPDFNRFTKANIAMRQDQQSFFEAMRSARNKEAEIIRGQIDNKKQAILSLKTDLSTAHTNYKISQNMYERRQALNQKGYASDLDVLEEEKRLNEIKGNIERLENQILVAQHEISEFEGRLSSLNAKHKDEALEKLSAVSSEKAQNLEIIHKLEERISRLDIKAPSKGLIKGLNVNTIGAVVKPGQTIMEIVPLGRDLEVEVKISPKDIGHLAIGQPVQVKFSTFDFSRYGFIEGQLEQISATTFSGENGERYYQGRITLGKNYVGQNPDNMILPGMTVMADVITGKKTILEYLLKPIQVSLKTAFTER